MKYRCPDWPPDWPEIEQGVVETVRSGDWGRYDAAKHDVLRDQIARSFQTDHVRLTCSGSAAIEISLRAADVGAGDEVLVAAYDYLGNFRAIELLGACPVLLDVDESSFSIPPPLLETAKSPKVKALVASHLYGHASPMAEFRKMCDSEGWVLIEDACQTPGLLVDDHPAGTLGDMGTLSFGGSKPVTAGRGGAILTNHARYASKINTLVDRPSDVYAMSSLQAAALSPQFEKLIAMNQMRQRTASAIARASERFGSWSIHEVAQSRVSPAYYKLAFSASSAEQRARVVSSAHSFGLPIGEGFRSTHKRSEKRCRKPVDLSCAARLSETVFVLDHRALLINADRDEELIGALAALHDETA